MIAVLKKHREEQAKRCDDLRLGDADSYVFDRGDKRVKLIPANASEPLEYVWDDGPQAHM